MILPWTRRRRSGSFPGAALGSGLYCAALHRYHSEVPRMNRQNLFSDVWDGENDQARRRHRVFWRPDNARMGATLYELAPGAPDMRLHMHFGAEEMFFVLSGRPLFRNQRATEELSPGDFVSAPRGVPACTRSATRPTNRRASLRSAPGASRTSSLIPKRGTPGWRRAIPTPSSSREGAIPASSPASRSRSRSPPASNARRRRRSSAGSAARPAGERRRRPGGATCRRTTRARSSRRARRHRSRTPVRPGGDPCRRASP